MNARDGMRRLRAERITYGLCVRCGKRLENGYTLKNCPMCLQQERERQKGGVKRANK